MAWTRLRERVLMAAAVVAVGWSVLAACSGAGLFSPSSSGSGSTAGCYYGATPITCNAVQVAVTTDGPFHLTVNGLTLQGFTSTSTTVWSVTPGTYDIAGTSWANNLTVKLTSVTTQPNAAVIPGSVTAVSGPGPTVASCAVTYSVPTGGVVGQTFLARYTLGVSTTRC